MISNHKIILNLSSQSTWVKPSRGVIKINADVAVGSNHVVAIVVTKNWRGELVFACSERVETALPLQAEAEAMRWAVCMSIGKDFGSIVLEGDSLICYQALCLSDSTVPWRIGNIIQDIFLMVSHSHNVSFSWVSRVANGTAHCFVKWSLEQ